MVEHMDLEFNGPADDAESPVPVGEAGGHIGEGFVLQTSARVLRKLGESKGYTAVFASRINTIFVRSDEAEKLARTPVRLNIGAGDVTIPGYTSIDIKDGVEDRKSVV